MVVDVDGSVDVLSVDIVFCLYCCCTAFVDFVCFCVGFVEVSEQKCYCYSEQSQKAKKPMKLKARRCPGESIVHPHRKVNVIDSLSFVPKLSQALSRTLARFSDKCRSLFYDFLSM